MTMTMMMMMMMRAVRYSSSSSSHLPLKQRVVAPAGGIVVRCFLSAATTAESSQQQHQQQQYHQQQKQRRSFHFGTREYASCFENLPRPDKNWLRQTAIDYLNNEFDQQRWYDDPIVSMVNGEKLVLTSDDNDDGTDGSSGKSRIMQETKNALGQVNGMQILASPSDIVRIQQHIISMSKNASSSSSSLQQKQKTDLRDIVRQMEEDLFTRHSGFLIINQCMDFQKQDGITEMEEAIQANVVERRLNDQLLQQESAAETAVLQINRQPIYVSCVSNFTNFLDLSRKTLRSLELGIPVIILVRTNTCQHAFRWTQLLIQLGKQYGLDSGMITFVSASLDDIVSLTHNTSNANTTGNLYATCSRSLARQMNMSYNNTNNNDDGSAGSGGGGKVIASTGGPNTLVLTMALSNRASAVHAHFHKSKHDEPEANQQQVGTEKEQEQDKAAAWSLAIRNAIRTSATIESSGQCTALRHAVVPTNTDMNQLHQVFEKDSVTLLPSGAAPEAMQKQQCTAVFEKHAGSVNPPTVTTTDNNDGYHYQESADAYYKLSDTLPTATTGDDGDGNDIPEYWRKVVVDFTRLDVSRNAQHLQQLIEWLNQHQPISLAINGPRQEAYQLALQLFDKTALVVYTIGSTDHVDTMPPALTCQARPQDGEVFGEFPPRFPLPLRTFTKFPVIVPSSNPSYDATYRIDYLKQQGAAAVAAAGAMEFFGKTTRTLLEHVQDDAIRGYCIVLIRYLQNVDASRNPKLGFGNDNRTTLWGLQRPPLGSKTHVHVAADTPWDAIAPLYILFHVTTARDQIELSIDSDSNEALIALCRECKLAHTIETKDEMTERLKNNHHHHGKVFAVESLTRNDVLKDGEFYMAGQFTSLYLPLGHIKSTMPNDEEFLFRARAQTNKWLSTLF